MLRRFADAHLRRILRRALTARDNARQEVRVLKAELAQSRAGERTNYDLAQRWKSIALTQAAHVEALRAEHRQETTP